MCTLLPLLVSTRNTSRLSVISSFNVQQLPGCSSDRRLCLWTEMSVRYVKINRNIIQTCTQVPYSPSSYILDSTQLVFPCLSSQTVSQSQSGKACQTSRLCSGGHVARLLSTILSVCTSACALAPTLERKDTCGLQMPAHTQGPHHFLCSVGKQRREKRSDWTTVLHWLTF